MYSTNKHVKALTLHAFGNSKRKEIYPAKKYGTTIYIGSQLHKCYTNRSLSKLKDPFYIEYLVHGFADIISRCSITTPFHCSTVPLSET